MSEPTEPLSPEQELPEYVIEGARSSRSRCKACRRPIQMGTLRIGMRIEGPFGTGYLWFHLKCAAKRQIDRVEAAYAMEAWKGEGAAGQVPSLASSAARRRAEAQKNEETFAELAPSSRSRCKQCRNRSPKARPASPRPARSPSRQGADVSVTVHPAASRRPCGPKTAPRATSPQTS
jgi:hypothetical protein